MTKSLSISLADPAARAQLGLGSSTGKRREVVQLAGDAPDPSGLTGLRGAESRTSLTAGRTEVVVVFGDTFMTLDVYAVPGEPLKVHLLCPRCRKHSTVPGDRKTIEFDASAFNPMRGVIVSAGDPGLSAVADFGRISIEEFECPWEMGDARHSPGRLHTGASLCRLRLAIEDNRAYPC